MQVDSTRRGCETRQRLSEIGNVDISTVYEVS